MPPDRGEDPQDALGVTIQERPAPAPAAPADAEPEDRKALNYAKEAVRKAEANAAAINDLAKTIVERLPVQAPTNGHQPPVADEKPPYSPAEIAAFQQAGEWQAAAEAQQENAQWMLNRTIEQTRQVARTESRELSRQDKLKGYLLANLGLTGLNDEERQLLVEEKGYLMREFGLDEPTAEVAARGIVNQRFRRGDVELPDLRQESKERGNLPPTTNPETAALPKIEVDWDAPNRGLTQDMIEKLRSWKLDKVLTKSQDPRLEEEFRSIVRDVVADDARRRRR